MLIYISIRRLEPYNFPFIFYQQNHKFSEPDEELRLKVLKPEALEDLGNPHTMLSGTTIDLIAEILAKKSKFKPQSVFIHLKGELYESCKEDENDVQILYGNNSHWICSYYNADKKQFYLYNSLYHANGRLLKAQATVLRKLYPFIPRNELLGKVVFKEPILKQRDGISCGLFALHYMRTIIKGKFPDQSTGGISSKISGNYQKLVTHLRNDFKELVLQYIP